MIRGWETGKGVHQWYAIKGDHVITADSYHNLMIYILDFDREEWNDKNC